ncbi:MAG: hypothetical protein Q9220_003969 [cf. Caloplaca sp. 1 TL-2023]
MSSRALRKLQRERQQEQEQQKELQQPGNVSDDEPIEAEQKPKPKTANAFDMLDQEMDEETAEDKDEQDIGSDLAERGIEVVEETIETPALSQSKSKSKQKKKKKGQKKTSASASNQPIGAEKDSQKRSTELDEIDLALKSLSAQDSTAQANNVTTSSHESFPEMYRLLAVDPKALNAANEMKRLFGNVVLEAEHDEPAQARRRGRVQHLDLGGALAGRNSPVSRGQGLAGLALRRNVFIAGKEEWPKGTSGGLGMELVERLNDGTTEYRFVHNTAYQDVQGQFETCVESLDPQRLIHLLQFNPYHISTLLQVSEIAKQQGDHSVSGDLLERALFSFGRSVHSTFITALSDGKARLDFRRPENREFWLAAWRYVGNLGQRGTWRTSYEWAKLVLSLDPEGDPYCVAINLDQLALRGGQAEHFLKLCKCSPLDHFSNHPGVAISTGLAMYRLKDAQGSRSQLRKAIEDYPYVFTSLFHALNIDHPPKAIWGQKPRSTREEFECEAYVYNAKDLWNTPEAISFLVEVAESTERKLTVPMLDQEITLDEARHILLSGAPNLINLLPRTFTTMQNSSSDPLPPLGNLPSYSSSTATNVPNPEEESEEQPTQAATSDAQEMVDTNGDEVQELQGLQNFFSRIVPWFGESRTAPDMDDRMDRAVAESGVPQEVITERGSRLVQLLQRVMGRTGNDDVAQTGGAQREELLEEIRRGHDLDNHELAEMPELVPFDDASPSEWPTQDQTPSTTQDMPYDDERNQRWLAGQGMIRLRDFTAQHGADEKAWGSHSQEGEALVSEYVRRVQQLRQQRTRDFIVNYPLRQGTSTEVRDLVQRRLEHQRP